MSVPRRLHTRFQFLGIAIALIPGCGKQSDRTPVPSPVTHTPGSASTTDPWADPVQAASLVEARAAFRTKLIAAPSESRVSPKQPPSELRLVRYDATPGQLAAYLTPDPGDGRKHPAIVWITGGDTNSIGDVWSPSDPSNDQTARQYRAAGIVTMYPSLRGGNDNPGRREGFYGEVDDVLAAARFLAKQPYVDPERIYLGGHSTGGTLALLVAAAAPPNLFRAVIAFGPVHDLSSYGVPNEFCPFDMNNPVELELRSPRRWINTVSAPTFVLEGAEMGNLDSIRFIKLGSKNPLVQFFAIPKGDHFSILAPLNRYLAAAIIGAWSNGPVELSDRDIAAAMSAK
jgi:acetyl esterase/lipase